MQLSEEQATAFDKIMHWFNETSEQEFVLSGFAGTGKTTLARYIEDAIQNVYFCAFTGKAANVLREKGCMYVSTIHSAIYSVRSKPNAEIEGLKKELTDATENNNGQRAKELTNKIKELSQVQFGLAADTDLDHAALVIVDEYSMLSQKLINDLRKKAVRILYIGDPFQLAPIRDTNDLEPNFTLQEIHRQAKESAIIRASMEIRAGRMPAYGVENEFSYIDRKFLDKETLLSSDVLIVGRNKTRSNMNAWFRKNLGFNSPMPQKGDKMICRKNDKESGFFNGMTAKCVASKSIEADLYFKLFIEEHDKYFNCYAGHFAKGIEPYDGYNKMHRELQLFEFSYAITCHLSQGSEYGTAIVKNEPIGRDSIERARWLYTAVTRAKEKCILVDG